jgi:hypothetical protein
MDENKKSVDGVIQKLAIISDAIESLFPDGKCMIAFELKEKDYKTVQKNFRDVDRNYKQFKIDISNTEFIFLLDELLNTEEGSLLKTPD